MRMPPVMPGGTIKHVSIGLSLEQSKTFNGPGKYKPVDSADMLPTYSKKC